VPLAIIAAVFIGVWLAFQIVVSPLGLTIGWVLVVVSIAYGAYASWQQGVDQRLWDSVKDVKLLSGPDFENHVAETYRRLGYRVEVTKQSGDQGVDVIADNGTERLAIQTKQYTGSVGNDSVQEANAGKTFYNCTQAVVVCTSTFTSAARALARATNVELIDGKAYAQLVQHTRPKALPKRLPIPSGPPLVRELILLGAGALVLFVHSLGPSLVQPSRERYEPAPDVPASTPVAQYSAQPTLSIPSARPSSTRKATIAKTPASTHRARHEAAKHPPWWTPPPSNTPSPIPVKSEEATIATPAPQVSAGAGATPSTSPMATAVPPVTATPEPTPS